jgi:hypothetical protein
MSLRPFVIIIIFPFLYFLTNKLLIRLSDNNFRMTMMTGQQQQQDNSNTPLINERFTEVYIPEQSYSSENGFYGILKPTLGLH